MMTQPPTPENVCSEDAFLYFVRERESLRIIKEAGLPAPWTQDPILQKYKFTNIRRRDDRVSKWIIDKLIQPAVDSGDEHLWFTLLIARLINWPPMLQRLLDAEVIPCRPQDFNAAEFVRVIEDFKSRGAKAYSGAYMIYPGKIEGLATKSEFIAYKILPDAADYAPHIRRAENTRWIEVFLQKLSNVFGVSDFMAGQVAADLTYARGHLDIALDLYTFAPLGPGSQKGLNFIYGHAPGHAWTQRGFNETLIRLNRKIGRSDLTLHDVQNCCCEFSKYARKVLGTGGPKSIYNAETEF